MQILSNHKKGPGLAWTLEFHFIPQAKAETSLSSTFTTKPQNKLHKLQPETCGYWNTHLVLSLNPSRANGSTCKTKAKRKKQEKNNRHQQGGELDLPWLSCCVASFLPGWIPGCLTTTSHDDKTTLCDCWLFLGLITISLQRVKSGSRSPKAAETVLALFLCADPIIPSGPGLGLPPGPKAANQVKRT